MLKCVYGIEMVKKFLFDLPILSVSLRPGGEFLLVS